MRYTDPSEKKFPFWIGKIFFLLFLIFVLHYPEWELRYKNSKVKTVRDVPSFDYRKLTVTKGDTTPEGLQSRMFQRFFSQAGSTSGMSPDELNITFDSAVEVHGILFSVDCWKSTRLVEFAAGINQSPAYQSNGPSNMLAHVSFATNNEAGKIDEAVWFPKPFILTPTDSLNIGSWIQNVSGDTQTVSPEIIVYFTWKPTSAAPAETRRR